MKFKKHFAEDFEEVLVTDTSIKHLFYEHLFVRIFELSRLKKIDLR